MCMCESVCVLLTTEFCIARKWITVCDLTFPPPRQCLSSVFPWRVFVCSHISQPFYVYRQVRSRSGMWGIEP